MQGIKEDLEEGKVEKKIKVSSLGGSASGQETRALQRTSNPGWVTIGPIPSPAPAKQSLQGLQCPAGVVFWRKPREKAMGRQWGAETKPGKNETENSSGSETTADLDRSWGRQCISH